jgi:hypothetical protein
VTSGDIEVMDRVAVEIAMHADGGARNYVQGKRKATLLGVAARLQANFHHAFAYFWVVAESGNVANEVDHEGPETSGAKANEFRSFLAGLQWCPPEKQRVNELRDKAKGLSLGPEAHRKASA